MRLNVTLYVKCLSCSFFDDRIIFLILWPHLPHLNAFHFYLLGMLKDEVNSNKPYTEHDFKTSI
jgi:hypothetical protein